MTGHANCMVVSTSPRTRSHAPHDTGYDDNAENDPDDRVKWSIPGVAPRSIVSRHMISYPRSLVWSSMI